MEHFEEIIKLHIKSITERNLTTYLQFLHPSHNCIVILPNGRMIEGYDDILNLHKEWFEDLDWSMDAQIVDLFSDENTGYALLDVIYHDIGQDYNAPIKLDRKILDFKIDDG